VIDIEWSTYAQHNNINNNNNKLICMEKNYECEFKRRLPIPDAHNCFKSSQIGPLNLAQLENWMAFHVQLSDITHTLLVGRALKIPKVSPHNNNKFPFERANWNFFFFFVFIFLRNHSFLSCERRKVKTKRKKLCASRHSKLFRRILAVSTENTQNAYLKAFLSLRRY